MKLKTVDIASEAKRLVKGTGWLPAIFKNEGPQETTQMPGDIPEGADALADHPAVTGRLICADSKRPSLGRGVSFGGEPPCGAPPAAVHE